MRPGLTKDALIARFKLTMARTGGDTDAAVMEVAALASRDHEVANVYKMAHRALAMAESARAEANRVLAAAKAVGGVGMLRLVGAEERSSRVIAAVASRFVITERHILSTSRLGSISMPRHVCMYIMHVALGMSQPDTARALGLANHTSVNYGCKRVSEDAHLVAVANEIADAIGMSDDAAKEAA